MGKGRPRPAYGVEKVWGELISPLSAGGSKAPNQGKRDSRRGGRFCTKRRRK